jgi:anti-sigma regulatory factor (Ser/Thr protein kinase)
MRSALPRESEPGEAPDLLVPLRAALLDADDLDGVARSLVAGLTQLPGVRRIGIALAEVGGRRLKFVASDAVTDQPLGWCHIDAYEDVPLTAVVRTGEPMFRHRGRMDRRFAGFVAGQPSQVRAFAVVPLPGTGSPIGGLVLFLDESWPLDDRRRQLLELVAWHTAEAVRRIRASSLADDEAALVEVEADHVDRVRLEADPRSVSMARRWLRDFLATADAPEDLADTAQLCLSELATNAVMHASGSYELRAALDSGVLTVVVRDHGVSVGAAPEPDMDADPLRVYGRGLQLVEALADRWGSERGALGSTVWFVLEPTG